MLPTRAIRPADKKAASSRRCETKNKRADRPICLTQCCHAAADAVVRRPGQQLRSLRHSGEKLFLMCLGIAIPIYDIPEAMLRDYRLADRIAIRERGCRPGGSISLSSCATIATRFPRQPIENFGMGKSERARPIAGSGVVPQGMDRVRPLARLATRGSHNYRCDGPRVRGLVSRQTRHRMCCGARPCLHGYRAGNALLPDYDAVESDARFDRANNLTYASNAGQSLSCDTRTKCRAVGRERS